jgi:arylsulfatase A-like enzyme
MHITDWMPTLISAAGGSLEGILLDGINQWSALVGKETSPRREALLQYDEVKHIYALRRDNWKITNGTL